MRLYTIFRLALIAGLLLGPSALLAQDDPNEAPLGDVARNLRKANPSGQKVIDDDNLSQVMDQAAERHSTGSPFRFVMAGEVKGFQASAPDASCSLSFTAGAKALLSTQYSQMELPPADVARLEGPATIEGDALTVSIFNGTDWHLSEISVALTVVRKNAEGGLLPGSEVRPEKKPDATAIYRMRAAAPPFSTATFSAPMSRTLEADEEWHWAIIQARGYAPQIEPAKVETTKVEPAKIETAIHQPAAALNIPASLMTPMDEPESDLAPKPGGGSAEQKPADPRQ